MEEPGKAKINPWFVQSEKIQEPQAAVRMKRPHISRAWYPVLRFYSFLGLVSFRFTDKEPYLQFRYLDLNTLRCAVLFVLFAFTFGISLMIFVDSATQPATSIVDSSQNVLYYSHCCFTIAFFVFRGSKIVDFFRLWIVIEKTLAKLEINRNLLLRCWGLQLVMAILLSGDNIFYILSETLSEVGSWKKALEKLAGDESMKKYFGDYSYLYGVVLLFSETLGQAAWVLGDVVIVMCSTILRHYFQCLNASMQRRSSVTCEEIEEFRKNHLVIVELVQAVNETFSPLILYCFGSNVVYLLAVLYSGLAEDLLDPNLFVRITFGFTFTFLLLRIVVSSYTAARFAEVANETLEHISAWSSFNSSRHTSDYETRVRLLLMDRFVQQISCQPIGLGGGGFFVLNKTFIASLFSVIVTYEVIMLQLPR